MESSEENGCVECTVLLVIARHVIPAWFDIDNLSDDYDDTSEESPWRMQARPVAGMGVLLVLTDARERYASDRFRIEEAFLPSYIWSSPNVPSSEAIERVSVDIAGPRAAIKVQKWMKECESHELCSRPRNFTPTRLIDVGGQEEHIRLAQHVPADTPYVALSYCWGQGTNLNTLKENLDQHFHQIPISKMPESLQAIVRFTRDIGLRYLWIDALCIVQDDGEDWVRESTVMNKIYASADLVLANAVNGDCREPLAMPQEFALPNCCTFLDLATGLGTEFANAHRRYSYSSWFKGFLLQTGNVVLNRIGLRSTSAFKSDLQRILKQDDVPFIPRLWGRAYLRRSTILLHMQTAGSEAMSALSSRGWTFQEQHLARRMVTFSHLEMRWSCEQVHRCECGNHFQSAAGIDGIFPAEFLSRQKIHQTLLLPPSMEAKSPATSTTRDLDNTNECASLDSTWMMLCCMYSSRRLTQSHDRLIAIAGMKSCFEDRFAALGIQTRYIGGLWEHQLRQYLLWGARPDLVPRDGFRMKERLSPDRLQMFEARIGRLVEILSDEEPWWSGKPRFTLAGDKHWRTGEWANIFNGKVFSSWMWASTRMPVAWLSSFPDAETSNRPGEYPPRMGPPSTQQLFDPAITIQSVDTTQPTISKYVRGHLHVEGKLQPQVGRIEILGAMVPVKLRSVPGHPSPIYHRDLNKELADMRMRNVSLSEGLAGPLELFHAYESSRHQVLFPGCEIASFIPDSPALFGDQLATVYQGWGLELASFLQRLDGDSPDMPASDPARLRTQKQGAPFKDMAPCITYRIQVEGIDPNRDAISLCSNPKCPCHVGWTSSETEPIWALLMGHFTISPGTVCGGRKKKDTVVYILVRKSPCSEINEAMYERIGIGLQSCFDSSGIPLADLFANVKPQTMFLV